MKYLIPLGAFFGLVVVLWFGLENAPRVRDVPSPFIGKPAPTINLPSLKDSAKTVTNDSFAGEVALVNVWATWCVSCRSEHETLMAFARTGVAPLYGLNYKDERDAALAWLQRLGDPYVANGFDPDGRAGIDWGVYGTPETFVIDRKGIVRYKHTGPISPRDLQEKILPLVNQLKSESV